MQSQKGTAIYPWNYSMDKPAFKIARKESFLCNISHPFLREAYAIFINPVVACRVLFSSGKILVDCRRTCNKKCGDQGKVRFPRRTAAQFRGLSILHGVYQRGDSVTFSASFFAHFQAVPPSCVQYRPAFPVQPAIADRQG